MPASLKAGVALSYIPDEWRKFLYVLDNGRLPLDTNFVEGRIRPFTIDWKNRVFSDTLADTHTRAMIYSVVEAAKANKIEPRSYLQYVIENLPLPQSMTLRMARLHPLARISMTQSHQFASNLSGALRIQIRSDKASLF